VLYERAYKSVDYSKLIYWIE